MKSKQEIENELYDFVLRVNKKVTRDELNGQTELLQKRIISSLQVMDLLLLIEKLTGKPIDVRAIKPGAFSSVDKILESFFKDAHS